MERNFRLKSYLSVFLRTVGAMFFTFLSGVFFVPVSNKIGIAANFIFGFCNLAVFISLIADYTMKIADKIANNVKYHGWKDAKNFGLELGAVAVAPSYLTALLVVLSALGALPNVMTSIYNLLNMYYIPILALAADLATPAADLPAGYFAIMFLLPLSVVVITQLVYSVFYKRIDLKQKIVYKNNAENKPE